MAQVSESTPSLQEAARSLQSQSSRQNEQVTQDREEASTSNSRSQARQTEDRVVISREAQTENSATRTEERGAAQRLNDSNKTTLSRTRDYEGQGDRVQTESTRGNNIQETSTQRNRSESREATEVRDLIKSEASRNKNAEVQLREFQNQDKNELRIGPKKVSQSIDEIKGQREKSDKAQEVVFETPSQRIIQKNEPGGAEQAARLANNNARSAQAEGSSQPPSPTSVQTETGQNVDDLI